MGPWKVSTVLVEIQLEPPNCSLAWGGGGGGGGKVLVERLVKSIGKAV